MKLQFQYPENFYLKDKEIFYFLDQPEVLPTPRVARVSGWWDIARSKKMSLLFNALPIISSIFGLRKALKRFDTATWITNQFSGNYFHWFNDALPRLILLEEKGIQCPVLLLEDTAKVKYVQDSLRMLGWKYETVRLNTICKVNRLYLPEMTAGEGSQHPEYFKKVCKRLTRKISTAEKKIFISRKDSPFRNIIPSKEFEDLLIKNGVEIVQTDKMSFEDQISLFQDWSHLIAVHGAGLTNMAFMPEGKGKVLEIRRSDDKLNYCYFKMANVLKHRYFYFLAEGECITKTIQLDNVIVDINAFKKTLETFIQEEFVQDKM